MNQLVAVGTLAAPLINILKSKVQKNVLGSEREKNEGQKYVCI